VASASRTSAVAARKLTSIKRSCARLMGRADAPRHGIVRIVHGVSSNAFTACSSNAVTKINERQKFPLKQADDDEAVDFGHLQSSSDQRLGRWVDLLNRLGAV